MKTVDTRYAKKGKHQICGKWLTLDLWKMEDIRFLKKQLTLEFLIAMDTR